MILYVDNTNVVELRSLTNSVTGLADTTATVRVTLVDRMGTPLPGEIWPVGMAHAGDGLYRATLSHEIEMDHGRKYEAQVEAVGSGGEVGFWRCPVVAQTRRCS